MVAVEHPLLLTLKGLIEAGLGLLPLKTMDVGVAHIEIQTKTATGPELRAGLVELLAEHQVEPQAVIRPELRDLCPEIVHQK